MKNPILLAIDTSGAKLQLALLIGDEIDVFTQDIARGHAEIIFDRIKTLLAKNDISYNQLTRIAVTVGPGSFTGLRVGISVARSLALALDIEVVGISNLLALSLGKTTKDFAIMIDARRGEAYVQEFKGANEPAGVARVQNFEQAKDQLEAAEIRIFSDPEIDIKLIAKFALNIKAKNYLPLPCYIRKADAKVQTKGLIEIRV